jgi:N-acetylmuramoyl-L-alanine amidase
MRARRRLASVLLAAALVTTGCLGDDREVTITGDPGSATPHVSAPKSAATAPPKVPPAGGTAAVRTPSGLLGLWLGDTGAGPMMRTPCGSDAPLRSYDFVAPVDVVLDPGHGGLDPGAVSSTGVTEAELNLDIARRVRDQLTAKGITVELTRDGDYYRSIADRAELATAIGARAFVSIHHNSGVHPPQRLGPGTEVYHELTDADSRRLAGVLWEDVVAGLERFDIDWVASRYRGAVARADRDGDDFYGVLRRADTTPAVILEAAYLSGPGEAELVVGDEFRAAEATAIASGIERYLRTPAEGSGHLESFTEGGRARVFDLDDCEDPPVD